MSDQTLMRVLLAGLLVLLAVLPASAAPAGSKWQMGTPIATYWAGPPMTEATAKQMAEGGFNVVWCQENELDTAQKFGLRAMLHHGLLNPATLDDPAKTKELDALIARVQKHPALYAYFMTDEPSAQRFPALGKLIAYLRAKDPTRLAYLNLFPTYANNEQLGTPGDTVTAYQKHLDLYTEQVKPDLISYDHYHYGINGDGDQYFLNLGMIRKQALQAGVPFLNIVQACTWSPGMRVPNEREIRWLIYTSLAYGAQGISYYVYSYPNHIGAMALADGTPTLQYRAASLLNREFVAIGGELQPLRSLAAYHVAHQAWGAEAMPADCVLQVGKPELREADSKTPPVGLAVGLFGPAGHPTHAVIVNLDYKRPVRTKIAAPAPLATYNATERVWRPLGSNATELSLMPGGGKLVKWGN